MPPSSRKLCRPRPAVQPLVQRRAAGASQTLPCRGESRVPPEAGGAGAGPHGATQVVKGDKGKGWILSWAAGGRMGAGGWHRAGKGVTADRRLVAGD